MAIYGSRDYANSFAILTNAKFNSEMNWKEITGSKRVLQSMTFSLIQMILSQFMLYVE